MGSRFQKRNCHKTVKKEKRVLPPSPIYRRQGALEEKAKKGRNKGEGGGGNSKSKRKYEMPKESPVCEGRRKRGGCL